MPFKDYAVIVLIALAAFVTWDWLHTRDQLATETANHEHDVQALNDSVRSKDEALKRLNDEADSTRRALKQASSSAAAARARADELSSYVDALAGAQPAVVQYLDTPVPPALLERLRSASDGGRIEDRDRPGAPGSATAGAGSPPRPGG